MGSSPIGGNQGNNISMLKKAEASLKQKVVWNQAKTSKIEQALKKNSKTHAAYRSMAAELTDPISQPKYFEVPLSVGEAEVLQRKLNQLKKQTYQMQRQLIEVTSRSGLENKK